MEEEAHEKAEEEAPKDETEIEVVLFLSAASFFSYFVALLFCLSISDFDVLISCFNTFC